MIENAKKIAQRVAVAGSLMLAAAAAHAELPTAATAAFTTVASDAGAMLDAGWPVLVGITGGFVLMKLFKKVVSRAS